MAKSYYLAIFPMALAIISVCNANEDFNTVKKGIESLSKTMIKYQSEFDRKVQFKELQEVIGTIDESMMGYMGTAVRRLENVRSLNSKARISYSNCVKPVFEWCIGTNVTFHTTIRFIDSELSQNDRKELFKMILNAINMGLKHTESSLKLLNDVIRHTTELKDLFQSIKHDVADDFGENGYYGRKKMNVMENFEKKKRALAIKNIFTSIGAVIYGPIGSVLGLPAASGIANYELWINKLSFEVQLKEIDNFFKILLEKIRNASEIVQNINSALEEDKTNLHVLRGKLSAANMNKVLLTFESRKMQVQIIPSLRDVADQCIKYITWHGYNSSIYEDSMVNSMGTPQVVLFSTNQRMDPLIDHLDDKPTVLASELQQVEDPKQVKHVSEDEGNTSKIESPPSSTPPSDIQFVATFFKHVV